MKPLSPAPAPGEAPAMQPAWCEAREILVVRLDNLGDLLMTTPAIAAIGHTSPHARITLLASKGGASAARHLPGIDAAIAYDAPWVKGQAGSARDDRKMIAALARRRFDAAVIFTVCTQSALPAAMLCRLAGIPLRLAHGRENPYDLLTDWVPDPDVCADGMRHEVQRQLDLVRSVGYTAADPRLVFRCLPGDVPSLRKKFAAAGGDPLRPYVVVHPGATAASRRYPAERFGMAARWLGEHRECQFVFSGGPDEIGLAARAQQQLERPAVSLAGKLTLGELAALVAGAEVVICNNSGPAHLAAAFGTPVVVLYALTNPQHTPWHVRSQVLNKDVPCRNCLKSTCPQVHHACLLGVGPEAVAHAALALMDAAPVGSASERQRQRVPAMPASG